MKKILSLSLLLLLINGCDPTPELDPGREWKISGKDIYVNDVLRVGLSKYQVTDGVTHRNFDDSTYRYHIGDTIGHKKIIPIPEADKPVDSLKVIKH